MKVFTLIATSLDRITVFSRGTETSLQIVALAINNNTVIKCGALSQGIYMYSEGVDLRVQGT